MIKPSLPLLAALYKEKVIYFNDEPIKDDLLQFLFLTRCYTNLTAEFISIYKLTDMMKTWLLDTEYELDIHLSLSSVEAELIGECEKSGEFGCLKKAGYASDEYQAVLIVAEWALKENKND